MSVTSAAASIENEIIKEVVCYARGLHADSDRDYGLAKEFIKFLKVRADHRDASPSIKLNTLWNRVLIDTVLCQKLYCYLNNGNVIHHYPRDDENLDEHENTVRRLYAMTELRKRGSPPVVYFWTEDSTMMSRIRKSTIDGITMYVTDKTTFEDIMRISNMLSRDGILNKKKRKATNSHGGGVIVPKVNIVNQNEAPERQQIAPKQE